MVHQYRKRQCVATEQRSRVRVLKLLDILDNSLEQGGDVCFEDLFEDRFSFENIFEDSFGNDLKTGVKTPLKTALKTELKAGPSCTLSHLSRKEEFREKRNAQPTAVGVNYLRRFSRSAALEPWSLYNEHVLIVVLPYIRTRNALTPILNKFDVTRSRSR